MNRLIEDPQQIKLNHFEKLAHDQQILGNCHYNMEKKSSKEDHDIRIHDFENIKDMMRNFFSFQKN